MNGRGKKRQPAKDIGRKKKRVMAAKPTYGDMVAYSANQLFSPLSRHTPLPMRLTANLRYAFKGTLNIGVGGIASTRVFRANSCFDPDQTGIGNQPRGFDQLQAMYDHHIVMGSKCTAYFAPLTVADPIICANQLRTTSTPDSNIITTAEGGYPNIHMWTSGSPAPKLVQTFAPSVFGIKEPLDSQNLKGGATSNPAEEAFYHIIAESATSTDEGSFGIFVVIEYNVKFVDPIRPPQS